MSSNFLKSDLSKFGDFLKILPFYLHMMNFELSEFESGDGGIKIPNFIFDEFRGEEIWKWWWGFKIMIVV